MRWAWALACLFLFGCTREIFDHSPAIDAGETSADAGPDAGLEEIDCAIAEPGTRCDDDNVCTPVSTCRDGVCLAGTTSHECLVASNSDAAQDEQGKSGWYYGFWNADRDEDGFYDSDTDFEVMEYCDSDGNWRPPGVCAFTRDEEGWRWTSNLGFSLQHPETMPDLELPVRRWISNVSGPARLVVSHHVPGDYGDGTRAILLMNGDELWRNDAIAGDTLGTDASFEVQLEVGTVIEQLVHPIVSSADDTTYFDLRVEGR